jgi:hypothetical protein
VHPADNAVLSRVNHGFDLKCLPGCFWGPLRTAPVVLLYLSPGWSERNLKEAKSKLCQEREMGVRRGGELMDADGSGVRWLSERTKCFDLDWHQIRSKMAVLNIGGYHSKTFADAPLLAALPSSRASVGWAQDVLFPQAIAGERVVVCLRAARFWGLNTGEKVGKSLFAPHVTRGGHMKHGKMRDQIIRAVRAAVGRRT